MPRGKRDPWSEFHPPNYGSKLATPTSLRIDIHYAHLQIWERWTWERFVRLAKLLNVTLPELASTACISHRALPIFEAKNRVHNGRSQDRAAALVLTMLEAHVASAFTTDVVSNPMPNLEEIGSDLTKAHA